MNEANIAFRSSNVTEIQTHKISFLMPYEMTQVWNDQASKEPSEYHIAQALDFT